MNEETTIVKCVLITGGTSGLGLKLVKLFLNQGFHVVATGRQEISLQGFEDRFKLFKVDFTDLRDTACTICDICKTFRFDYIVNNAGILSPKEYTETDDGLERTFQVNFLAHLLVNEIIIRNQPDSVPLRIVATTSPIYKLAKAEPFAVSDKKGYRSFKAYSYSKLFISMMCQYLPAKYQNKQLTCFSFDPGVFSSGIFRMQNPFLRYLYRVAAPFMRNPGNVALALYKTLVNPNIENGAVYDIRGRAKYLPRTGLTEDESFWRKFYNLIEPALNSCRIM